MRFCFFFDMPPGQGGAGGEDRSSEAKAADLENRLLLQEPLTLYALVYFI